MPGRGTINTKSFNSQNHYSADSQEIKVNKLRPRSMNITGHMSNSSLPTPWKVGLQTSVLLVIASVAVLFNFLVCATVYFRPSLRTVTNSLVVNLAVADILVAVVNIPFLIVSIVKGGWKLGELWCRISGFTNILFCGASISTLAGISLERYYSAAFPSKPQRSSRRVAIIIIYVWFHAAAFSVGPLISPTETFDAAKSHCVVCWQESNYDVHWYGVSILVGLFLLPLLVMTVAYVLIFKKLSDKARKLKSYRDSACHQECADNTDILSSPAASCWKRTLMNFKKSRSAAQLVIERKMALTVLTVIGVFLVCWLPFYTLNLWTSFQDGKIPDWADFLTCLLAYANSAFNPLIYGLKNKKFFETFKAILRCKNPRHINRSALSRSASVPVLSSICISRQSIKRRLDPDVPPLNRKRATRTKSEGDDGLSDCDNMTVMSAPGITTIAVASPLGQHNTNFKKLNSNSSLGKHHKKDFSHCLTLKNCYAGRGKDFQRTNIETVRNAAFSQQSPLRRPCLYKTMSAPPLPMTQRTPSGFLVTTAWQIGRPQNFRIPRKLPTIPPRLRMEHKQPQSITVTRAGLSKLLPAFKRGSYNFTNDRTCTSNTHLPATRSEHPKSPVWLLKHAVASDGLSASESIV